VKFAALNTVQQGHTVALLVEPLRYNPQGREFYF
jgi:hypothetical protein